MFKGYNDYIPNTSRDIAFGEWWPQYSKALYILSRTIAANIDKIDMFITNLIQVIPNAQYRNYFLEFYNMDPKVIQVLLVQSPNIFLAYPWLERDLRQSPVQFRESCFKNINQLFFIWVYLLHSYFIYMYNADNPRHQPYKMPTLNDQRAKYRADDITKQDWGRSFWFVLHTSSLYAPPTSIQAFKNLLYSLQWLLPCPKCKEHLVANLKHIHLEERQTPRGLFEATWILHNLVNIIIKAPQITLNQALALYTF